MGRGSVAIALGTVVAIGVVAACAQLVGIGDAPPTKLTCGALLGDGGCQACAVSACCVEMEACAASASCRALETCLASCNGVAECRATCTIGHPVLNDPTLPALTACLASRCDNTCGPACGWFADYVSPDAAPACQACSVSQICDGMGACFSDPDCARIVACVNGATTLDRKTACQVVGDAASPLWRPNFVTTLSPCANDCEFRQDWTCVGHVSSPRTTLASTTSIVTVSDPFGTQLPIPNVTVTVCQTEDTSCALPGDTSRTDSDGGVTLTIPTINGYGSTGYLELSSDAGDGGIVPELFYWSFSLSEPTYAETVPAATPKDFTILTLLSGVSADLLDMNHGHVVATALDCRSTLATNVQFALGAKDTDSGAQTAGPFYLKTGGVSTDSTSDLGTGYFVNVPVGINTLTATPKGLGKPSGNVNFYVRGGTVTVVLVPPTP